MEIKKVIQSQYYAALKMLQQTVENCPDTIWNDDKDAPRFWQIVFHTLFYVHLYLQPEEKDFIPWEKQRGEAQFLGNLPWAPDQKPVIGEPYSKEEILQYLDFCQNEVDAKIPLLDLKAASGFAWLPMNKLELQVYNIRHIMQHTGELSTILRLQVNRLIDWIGMKPNH